MTLFAETRPFLAAYGLTLVPVVLGAAAVYLLLPRPRNRFVAVGAPLGALAILAAGFALPHAVGRVSVEAVLFYAFAGLAVLGAGLMITMRSPARAAICFALVVLSTCGLFLLQAAPFLMAATAIIYAGAIIVTFLFVIMLSQQEGYSDADERSREPFLSTVAGFGLTAVLLLMLQRTYDTQALDSYVARADAAGRRETALGVREALGGSEREYLAGLRKEAERARRTAAYPALIKAVEDADAALNWPVPIDPNAPPDPAPARTALREIAAAGAFARSAYGLLQPPATAKLSPFSGPPPNTPSDGRPPALPAENVAALGYSLFSDFLLAVELGGTLLLVATVGAIAITGRREEAAT
jgi:NADH:ubiquinone oxidoreductase subunit 6 (subunit J)